MKTLLFVFMAGIALAGCGGGPCDTLQTICNTQCSSSSLRQACSTVVSTYRGLPGGDVQCQAAIDAKICG